MQYPLDSEICELLSDEEQKKQHEGFELLLKKYNKLIFYVVRKFFKNDYLVEEVVSDVYFDLWNPSKNTYRKLRNFNPKHDKSLSSFLAKTARFKALERLRPGEIVDLSYSLPEDFDPEDLEAISLDLLFSRKESSEIAWKIVETLEAIYKEVVILRYRENYSHKDIAKALAITEDTSKTRLRRANKMILQRVKDEGYDKDDLLGLIPLWWIFRRDIQEATYQAKYGKPIDNTQTNKLGDFIRGKRYERSLSRYELSQKTGLERPLLAALENGRILQLDIKAEWLDAIAKSLNINPTELELQTHANKEITKSTIESRSKHKNIGRENSPPQQKRQTGKRTIRWLTMLVIVIFVYTNWSDIMDYVNDLPRTVSEQPVSATIPPSSQLSCVIEGGNPNFRDKQGKVVEGDYLISGTEVFVIGTANIPGEGDYYLVQTKEGREGLIYNIFCNVSPIDLLPEVTLIPSEVMANESSQIEAAPSNDENDSHGPLNIPAAWQYKGDVPRNCRLVEGDKMLSLPDIIEGWYTYNIASIYITERNEEVALYETTGEKYNYVDSLGNRLTINPELGLLTTSFLGEQPSICYPPSEFLQLEVDSSESSCGNNPIVSNNITLRSTSTIYFKWQVSNSESIAFYRYQLRRLWRYSYSKETFEQPGGVDPYLIPPLFEGTTTEPATSIPFDMVFEAGPNELSEFDIFELGVSIVSLDGGVFDYSKIQFGGIENLLTFKEICSLDQGEY